MSRRCGRGLSVERVSGIIGEITAAAAEAAEGTGRSAAVAGGQFPTRGCARPAGAPIAL